MKDHSFCTGCNACQAVCPHGAIAVGPDAAGFPYPRVDQDRCARCGLCDAICAKETERTRAGGAWCAQSLSADLLSGATSGGAASAIAERVIGMGGCVFAVQYDDVRDGARWVAVDAPEALKAVQGSKYFQVPLDRDVYGEIKRRAERQPVLFIGTPCQVDAVNKLVRHENLLTVDFICGGVASYRLEQKYAAYWSRVGRSAVTRHTFRKKADGWTREYHAGIEFADGTSRTRRGYDDLFNYLYNSGNCMRESCYRCEYASLLRAGDFTVGDAWGVEPDDVPEFDVRAGASLLLVNTPRAAAFIASMDSLALHEADRGLLMNNRPLHGCARRRAMRSISYRLLDRLPLRLAALAVNYRHTIKRIVSGGRA